MKKTIRACALFSGFLAMLFLTIQANTQTEKKPAAKAGAAAEKPAAKKVLSKEEKIKRAMMAAPASVSANATIMDWDNTELRKGTNGWTCFPDRLGNDPLCADKAWMEFFSAWMAKKDPPAVKQIGVSYMLVGDAPVSNKDPFASAPAADNEWIAHGVPHLMLLVPLSSLEGITTDFQSGGPYVMWAGTPYAHLMIPLGEAKHGMGHMDHMDHMDHMSHMDHMEHKAPASKPN